MRTEEFHRQDALRWNSSLLRPHSSLSSFRNLDPQPRRERASRYHAAIDVTYLAPTFPVTKHSFGDTRQRIARLRDVERGAILMTDDPARPNRLRVDHR